ncbi:MAG: response regulator [Roseiflexaceae bacterium]|nr:response regulator [Roseiflexaceae bacterium]
MSQTILIVDEESKLRDMIRVYLEQDSYRVVEAADGREALYVARHEKPDLIILDLMMPELGGCEFIRIFSKESQIPIIMLTARVEDQDKILGLELGADDYVTKPFNVRELIARMRAVLRRTQKAPIEPDFLRAFDIVLDRVGDQYVDLTPAEFEILATLMAAPRQVFSRLDLLDRMSGKAYEGYERTITGPGEPGCGQCQDGPGRGWQRDRAGYCGCQGPDCL